MNAHRKVQPTASRSAPNTRCSPSCGSARRPLQLRDVDGSLHRLHRSHLLFHGTHACDCQALRCGHSALWGRDVRPLRSLAVYGSPRPPRSQSWCMGQGGARSRSVRWVTVVPGRSAGAGGSVTDDARVDTRSRVRPMPERGTVLVVESDGDRRERLGRVIEGAGYHVMSCPGPSAPAYTCISGTRRVLPADRARGRDRPRYVAGERRGRDGHINPTSCSMRGTGSHRRRDRRRSSSPYAGGHVIGVRTIPAPARSSWLSERLLTSRASSFMTSERSGPGVLLDRAGGRRVPCEVGGGLRAAGHLELRQDLET